MRKRKGRVCIYYEKQRDRWRVEVTRPDRSRTYYTARTKGLAEEIAEQARLQFKSLLTTVDEARAMYIAELKQQGCKESHLVSTMARLKMMFPDPDQLLSELHPVIGKRIYDEMRLRPLKKTKKPPAVDTQRHALLQSRAFCNWLIERGELELNPFTGVKGIGKRKKGKVQLTIDEARRFVDYCLADDSLDATMALCCLLLAMRCGEMAGLSPRSIDDGGRLVRIEKAKTAAGVRVIEIPEILRSRMPSLANADLDRHAINRAVHRMCKRAGVTDVGPHALRGTHASLATRAGASSQLVAESLGHSSTDVTERHYTQPSAVQEREHTRALKVITGGRS